MPDKKTMPSSIELARKIRQIRNGAVACEASAYVMYKAQDEEGAANYIRLANSLWDSAFCLTLGEPQILKIGVIDGE